jgi:hypothetical protein
MMKRIIVLVIVFVSAVLTGCGEKKSFPASRLSHPAGEFSFVTPDGWFRTKLIGIDFIVVSTDPDFGISPNIFVNFVESSAQVSTVVAELIEANTDNYRAYKVTQQSVFVAEFGLSGVKVSARRENKDALPIAVFHYLIQDVERVIVITCTCADPVKQKYEPIFDAAMKLLKSERES